MATWDFSTSPIAYAYRKSRAFSTTILGPVGGGKTVPALQRIIDIGMEQEPSPDGIRRTRFAVVRNTMPELRGTTAVTYQQIYPPASSGDIIWRSPAEHRIAPAGSDIEIGVNLIALDKPKDVAKLLSLEVTGAFFNEIREIPRVVINRMTERCGRYLLSERVNTWRGIWADTNPPDKDHWLYKWDKEDRPAGYEFHHQPPGVLEVKVIPGGVEVADENFPEYQGKRLSAANVYCWYRGKAQWVECPVEIMRAADRNWIVSPWHENSVALSRVSGGANPLGKHSYYGAALAGKNVSEIRSYLQGVYTFVQDGRRCVPQYNDDIQAVDHLPVLKDVEICAGMDIGGGTLQPSCIFFQRHPAGTYLAIGEVVCYDLGIERFGELVSQYMSEKFPDHVNKRLFGTFYGDPAGEKRDEIFETKSFEFLRREHGFDMRAAPSQDPKMRIAAIAAPCERLINGKPGLLVHKQECRTLRKGLIGAWHFRRVQVTGDERFTDAPVKNDESHPCDAAGYGLLGIGEFIRLGGAKRTTGPVSGIAAGWDL